MIPFGSWTPDQPTYSNPGGSTIAKNVLPRTKGSFTNLNALAVVSNAIDARCQGAFASRDNDGNVKAFAADVSKLYESDGSTWTDVSNGTYAVGDEETVEFTQFGLRVISTEINGSPQTYLLGTDTAFSDLGGNPPSARHVGVWKEFVVLGNHTSYPNRVQWCAVGDPTDWPTLGSADAAQKQSDFQDLPEGGWVQRIVGSVGSAIDGLIFMDTRIYRVQYEGSPAVFGFYPIAQSRGTPAPNSVVHEGERVFWLDEDGFQMTDGVSIQAIGDQRVNKWFFNEVDQSYYSRMYGASDKAAQVVMWVFPENGSMTGNPSRYIAYHWGIDEWSHGEFDCTFLFKDLTVGYNLDNADGLGYTVDTSPYGPDSRAWTGGRYILSAFDTDNKLARFTGSSLAATVETGEYGGREFFRRSNHRLFVDGIRPYVDGGTVTVGLKYRDSTTGSVSTDGPNSVDGDGVAHFTRSCRYVRAQVNIASGGSWTHAQGVDFEVTDDGEV